MRNRGVPVILAMSLAMAGAMTGCSGSQSSTPASTAVPAPAPEPARPTAQDRLKWYQDCWEHFNTKRWEPFEGCYDAGAVSEAMDAGRPVAKGPDAILAAAQVFTTAFSDIKGTPQLLLANGEHMASLYLLTGTHTGPLAAPDGKAIPATGKPIGYMFGHVVRGAAAATMAIEERAYSDEGTMLAQIGVVPGPARPVMAAVAAPVVVTASGSANEKANIESFRRQMEAFSRHDRAAVEAFNAPDAVFHDYTSPQDTDSKGNAAMLEGFFKGFPDSRLSASSVWAAGDYVVAEGIFEGTNSGPMPAMGLKKATGKPVRVRFLEITRYRDGKVVEDWLIFNGMAFATQLGLMGS